MGISHLYAHAEPGMTGADILRVARNNMIADPATFSAGLGYNTLCYNYCGDPAVLSRSPHSASTSTIPPARQLPWPERATSSPER